MNKTAYLILADGTVFSGRSIGREGKTIGEVVFTTSMVGYQEALTDPANLGSILVQTFPLIGNYGINSFCSESDKVHLNGYIVRELCELPSNFRCEKTLGEFLVEQNVVGICDIDTRRLTKIIREKGVMNAMITTEEITDKDSLLKEIRQFSTDSAVEQVSTREKVVYKSQNPQYELAVLDLGIKKSLVSALVELGCNVTLLPFYTTAREIIDMKPDGVLVSDGPCDPSDNMEAVAAIKQLIKEGIPMLGISLGHQLMAMAHGASIVKLHYGHRGANQPVVSMENGRTYITTQNHGYVVDKTSLPAADCEVSFINANDKTCEGISYKNSPAFSVQFLPDTKEGMVSTLYIYRKFFDMMKKKED